MDSVIEVLPSSTASQEGACTQVQQNESNVLPVIPNRSVLPSVSQSPSVLQEKTSVLPTIIPPKLEMIEVVPSTTETTIIGVESLQLSALEGMPAAQYIQLPASSQLQIQVPISVAQSFDLSSHQGQQILLTSLANFDVTTVSNLQF